METPVSVSDTAVPASTEIEYPVGSDQELGGKESGGGNPENGEKSGKVLHEHSVKMNGDKTSCPRANDGDAPEVKTEKSATAASAEAQGTNEAPDASQGQADQTIDSEAKQNVDEPPLKKQKMDRMLESQTAEQEAEEVAQEKVAENMDVDRSSHSENAARVDTSAPQDEENAASTPLDANGSGSTKSSMEHCNDDTLQSNHMTDDEVPNQPPASDAVPNKDSTENVKSESQKESLNKVSDSEEAKLAETSKVSPTESAEKEESEAAKESATKVTVVSDSLDVADETLESAKSTEQTYTPKDEFPEKAEPSEPAKETGPEATQSSETEKDQGKHSAQPNESGTSISSSPVDDDLQQNGAEAKPQERLEANPVVEETKTIGTAYSSTVESQTGAAAMEVDIGKAPAAELLGRSEVQVQGSTDDKDAAEMAMRSDHSGVPAGEPPAPSTSEPEAVEVKVQAPSSPEESSSMESAEEDNTGTPVLNSGSDKPRDEEMKVDKGTESTVAKPTTDTEDTASGPSTVGAPPKHIRSKNVDPKVLEARRQIQVACRENDLEFAMNVYENAVESDTRLEAQCFYNLLNLCDGLERSVHVGTPKRDGSETSKVLPVGDSGISNKRRQDYAFRIKDHMAQLNLPLNETAYTALAKVLVRNKEYAKAEEVLDESESVQQCKPRLRLYSPLLTAYCEERLMIKALKCWLRISKQRIELTEREYVSLMKCATWTGDVLVFERILSDIADSVPVPSKDAVAAVLEWFESSHAVIHQDMIRIPKHANETEVKSLLDAIHKDEVESPKNMGPVQDSKGWNTSSAVPIDTKTGAFREGCLCDCTLKPVPLSERAWAEMTTMNETIVLQGQVEGNTSKFQGGRKGKMRIDFDPEERKEKWKQFTDFLEASGHIDVVIDAANVGYFKQNFGNAPKHVDYEQIDWVAQHCLSMGKKVLLFLHQRHFSPKLMPEKYLPLQREWEQQGILYRTPAGMNDDWFWLHAALKHRTLVLTNDEMRDHHFQMLAPRVFLRWKERHQVHFSFGDWNRATWDGASNGRRGRQVELEFPAVYSRRVQRVENGLVIPLIKRGDENRFLDGSHVADEDEPVEETYLCIRPMK